MALLLALLALLLPGTARAAPGACPNSDAPCPNIVTILADDLVRAAVHCLRRGPLGTADTDAEPLPVLITAPQPRMAHTAPPLTANVYGLAPSTGMVGHAGERQHRRSDAEHQEDDGRWNAARSALRLPLREPFIAGSSQQPAASMQ